MEGAKKLHLLISSLNEEFRVSHTREAILWILGWHQPVSWSRQTGCRELRKAWKEQSPDLGMSWWVLWGGGGHGWEP